MGFMLYIEHLLRPKMLFVKKTVLFYFRTVNGRVTEQNSATFYVKVAYFLSVNHRLFLQEMQNCQLRYGHYAQTGKDGTSRTPLTYLKLLKRIYHNLLQNK